ncbi:MAG: phage antirepressor [Butyricicoccus sp.]|nr:phage antirepressor [Butyricicoccus sp.]
MNELQIFKNADFGEIRTTVIDNEPWFVGKDVATALGYSNARDALSKRVDDEDKGVAKCDTLGGTQDMTVINESGVYALVFSSKLPRAKEFKRWVTAEVLPSIRKHGAYMTPETLEAAILNPDTMIRLCTALKDEQDKRRALESQVQRDAPKVLFANAVETSQTSILIGDLAKILKQNGVDIGQKRLFQWMRDNGYLIKSGSSLNMPTQRAMEMGLFEVKERTVSNPDGSVHIRRTTKVTGKGQQFFINKFLNRE